MESQRIEIGVPGGSEDLNQDQQHFEYWILGLPFRLCSLLSDDRSVCAFYKFLGGEKVRMIMDL